MSEKKILVVGEESAVQSKLCRLFARMGLASDSASDGLEGVARAAANGYDVVLLGNGLPGHNRIDLLVEMTEKRPETPVIMLTDCTSIQAETEAMRCGAYDCIAKPLEFESVRVVVERALRQRALTEENRRLRRLLSEPSGLQPLRDVERAHIERVLLHTGWNQSRAAVVLGIDRKTLRSKVKEFKLRKPEE